MREIIFKDLELENFKCHEEMSFSFIPNRFITIVGNNGTGKTTLFSALAWALYDQTVEGMTGDDIIRKKSGKNTVVRVTWDDGEDEYRVEAYRKHTKHKNNRYLFKNNKQISGTSQKETLEKISQLIMPKDVFFNCLLFSQFVKNHFIDLTPSGRNEILDSMLLLHRFDDWSNKTTELIKKNDNDITEYQKKIDILNAKIDVNISSKEEQEGKLKNIEENFKINREKQLSEISSCNANINNLRPKCDGLDLLKEQLNTLEINKSVTENKIQSQRELCISELREADSQKKNEELEIQIHFDHKLKEEISQHENSLSELQNSKREIDISYSNLLLNLEESASAARDRDSKLREKELEPISKKIQDLTSDFQELQFYKQQSDSNILNDRNQLESYTNSLNQETPICGACKQKLDQESRREIEALIDKIKRDVALEEDKLKEFIERITKKELELSSEKQNFENIVHKWEELDNVRETKILNEKKKLEEKQKSKTDELYLKEKELLDVISNKKEKNKKDKDDSVQNLIKKFSDLSIEIKEKHKKIAIVWAEEVSKIENEIKDVVKQIEEKQMFSEQLSLEEEKLKRLYQAEKHQQETVSEQISSTREHITRLESTIKESRDVIEEYQDKISMLERRGLILNFWKTGYSDSGIKSILLDDSIPILNEKARELCDLAPNLKIRFDSQSVLKSGDYRNKFNIDVLQTQNLSGLKELSSGEKRMTDIIVLLCLRHLLEDRQNTKMNILLLDEMLDSLDPENAALAVTMVKKISSNHCVALISHTLRDYIESDETYNLSA